MASSPHQPSYPGTNRSRPTSSYPQSYEGEPQSAQNAELQGFQPTPSWIWNTGLSSRARLVLAYYFNTGIQKEGWLQISQKEVAIACSISVATVRKAEGELQTAGVIRVLQTFEGIRRVHKVVLTQAIAQQESAESGEESAEDALLALIEKGYLLAFTLEGDPDQEVYLVPTGKEPPKEFDDSICGGLSA